MTLGERVRLMRTESELTQLEVAQAAGISISTLQRIESGAEVSPRVATLKAIAHAYECRMVLKFVSSR